VIVVATADFEVYHEVVGALRARGADFTTVEPGDDLPPETDLVIAGPKDDLDVPVDVVVADPDDPRAAVDEAFSILRGSGRTVVGIDPGPRPGIAVLSGDLVVAVFQVPVEDAADVGSATARGSTARASSRTSRTSRSNSSTRPAPPPTSAGAPAAWTTCSPRSTSPASKAR